MSTTGLAQGGSTISNFSRSPEFLIPAGLQPRAGDFCVALDEFMQDTEHKVLETQHFGIRLDRYSEGDDMVYSIIHAPNFVSKTYPRHLKQATSIILGADNRYYGERHLFAQGTAYDVPRPPHAGISRPLGTTEWNLQIMPVTRAVRAGNVVIRFISDQSLAS